MSGLRRLIPFFTANIFFATGLGFHAFLYNFYLESLGLSAVVMGRAAAAWSLGGLVVLLPVGRSVDRWGPKPVLIGAALCAALGLAWSAVVANPLTVYIASALAGAAGVSWRVAQAPVLMELTTPANRSRLFTLDVAVLVGVGAAGTALSAALVSKIGSNWHVAHGTAITLALVIGAALTGVSALVYSLLDLPPMPRTTRGSPASTVRIPANIIFLILLSGVWLAGLTLATPFFNVYFARTFRLPIERVSWILSATTVATAILLAGAGEVATRFGARRTFVFWLALFGPAMWGLALTSSVGVAAACYLLQNLVSPAANPLLDQLLFESVPAERRGVVSSSRQAMASAGQVLAQSIGGYVLAVGSFTVLFAFAGGVGLAAGSAVAAVAWRLNRR